MAGAGEYRERYREEERRPRAWQLATYLLAVAALVAVVRSPAEAGDGVRLAFEAVSAAVRAMAAPLA
ncbi:hypothetical protein [Allostreptomyces psammosilenae]|uniref:Fatty acid desaturase n=1 Tax=Allostreptomyces psammosilenae TaxID=1892865 RepID=A0A853A481_9ACTN|nr:hypothetical protein [Allostreptomyces psammosilenae]NYI05511.1 fatty acid desaturase [Allostreptomyces psammosilenae]